MKLPKRIIRRFRAGLAAMKAPRTGKDGTSSLQEAPPVRHCVDRYSVFQGQLHLAGWIHAPSAALRDMALVLPSGRRYEIRSFGQPSPDVAAMLGETAASCRFDEVIRVKESAAEVTAAAISLTFDGCAPATLSQLGAYFADPAHQVFGRFQEGLRDLPPGRFLEVGSRARSGVVRRNVVPDAWEYSGLDVMEGPNVDVVGDAHRLSSLYPAGHFDAVMACSVLEHLLMPWKFVLELNKVLKVNAIGVFTTHQCWPLHDQPWDFWRFSDQAWTGLLNAATGFEIIEAKMGEPAYVVAAKCHPATAFAEAPSGALASFVYFRKIAETELNWPVELDDITRTHYPTGTIDINKPK